MREVLAVIAGCIPPAAVRVERTFFRSFKGKVPVGLVEAAGAALAFEVVDDIRKCIALQQVLLNHKGKRADGSVI